LHRSPGHPPIPCLRETHGRCRICERITPGSPDFDAAYRARFDPPDGAARAPDRGAIAARTPDRDALAAARLAVLACDYRLDAAGLERGSGCGCTPATRCLLGRGKWPDDPGVVDYGDCLACTGGG
jgi:hypothetical protein